jgi:hypothetical protein
LVIRPSCWRMARICTSVGSSSFTPDSIMSDEAIILGLAN